MTYGGTDPNQLMRAAERAFAERRPQEVLALLVRVTEIAGAHGAVLHLKALALEQLGRFDDAYAAFEKARKADPGDPQIVNNLGNLLDSLGRFDEAARSYGAAIKRAPGWPDPLINRALTWRKMGDHIQARADLVAALLLDPGNARGWASLAALERDLERLDAAAEAYDRALTSVPDYPLALHGRARVALERGDAAAAENYRAALVASPGDRELILGLAESLDAQGDPEGMEILAATVTAQPDWIVGHEMLARFRAEANVEDFARSFADAITARPNDPELRRSLWRTLVRSNNYPAALSAVDAARHLIEGRPDMLIEEAAIASEAGAQDRAERLLALLPPSVDLMMVAGRHALRVGKAEHAARHLEQATTEDPENITAWAHLDLAWRLTGDARHEWLTGQPGLVGYYDTGLTIDEVAALAAVLRTAHRARAAPIGQSLRGGTQTRGRLLARTEPAIARLAGALTDVIERHRASLPFVDDKHPLLRYRNQHLRFDGSWSVRLGSGGNHVNHIHPRGIISSACHISLPPPASGDLMAGWLELGAPPKELGLALQPLTSIAPVPGHVALFPSYLFHGTRPFGAGERLTAAFDLLPQ